MNFEGGLIDCKNADNRKYMHELSARTKPWTVGTKSQVNIGNPHNDGTAKAGAIREPTS